ncbi:DUF6591 domain-containing protein [Bifidobacterium criceti]|uniref:DUF6591 domain-containing protein n=1 Tax=Bifidobacterium criceti TaxID=1960969 RepID=A0A2A2EG65_9BIFI|nr:DUF6591 domain-containing protein [Bifidobacterium criceti]PAU68244.1 hypothetical protein B1526_0429 [Bifidobacterium criceti]
MEKTTSDQEAASKKKVWVIAIVGVIVAALVAVGILLALHFTSKKDASAEASPSSASSQSAASDEGKKEVTPSTTDPEQVMKNYEEFMTKYAHFATLLNSDEGIPASEVEDYIAWNEQAEDIMAQLHAVQDTELTPEQQKEFDAMLDRVDDMMVEATGSELVRTPRTAEEAEQQAKAREKAAEESRNALSNTSGQDADQTE